MDSPAIVSLDEVEGYWLFSHMKTIGKLPGGSEVERTRKTPSGDEPSPKKADDDAIGPAQGCRRVRAPCEWAGRRHVRCSRAC